MRQDQAETQRALDWVQLQADDLLALAGDGSAVDLEAVQREAQRALDWVQLQADDLLRQAGSFV